MAFSCVEELYTSDAGGIKDASNWPSLCSLRPVKRIPHSFPPWCDLPAQSDEAGIVPSCLLGSRQHSDHSRDGSQRLVAALEVDGFEVMDLILILCTEFEQLESTEGGCPPRTCEKDRVQSAERG